MILIIVLLNPIPVQGQARDSTSGQDSAPTDASLDAESPVDVEAVLDLETVDVQRGQVVLEELSDLHARPLDINHAGWRELARLPTIDALTARRIVDYRQRIRGFARLSEITSVEGIDQSTLRSIRPYLTISPPDHDSPQNAPARAGHPERASWSDALRDIDIRISQLWSRRLDVGSGYTRDSSRSHYLGGPVRHATRTTLWLGDRLRAAGVFEKDPGEAWTWNPGDHLYGFDHVSGSLQIQGIGPIDHVVVGDFTVSLGQGVGVWSGFAFGKGRDPTGGVIRDQRGIRPFASTEENRFFRGLATEVNAGNHITVAGFASRRAIDARMEKDPRTGDWGVASLPSSGLHRTESERNARDALIESVVGGAIEMESRHVDVGIGGLYATTDSPLRSGERPYEAFDTVGHQVGVLTGYGTWFADRIRVAGEITRYQHLGITSVTADSPALAADASFSAPNSPVRPDPAPENGAWGGVIAIAYADERRTEAVLAGRSYGKAFDNRFGAGFSETQPQNETGLYAGVRLGIAPRWTISGYLDAYRSDWLRYQVYRPTIGREVRLLVEHNPRPWLSQYVQYRSETKEQDAVPPAGAVAVGLPRSLALETRWSLRWNAAYQFSDQFTLRSRIEYVRASSPSTQAEPSTVERGHSPFSNSTTDSETGILVSQDIDWSPHPKLRISGRLAHFDTRSYDARVFAYERDVLYSFRVPALSGRGERSYVLVRWLVGKGFRVEAKYGVTRYADRDTVGSGLDAVEGNRIRELRCQLHWRF